MMFVIPIMFLACLQLEPPLDKVDGFKFEQCVTMTVTDDRHVTVTNVKWLVPRFHYAIEVRGHSLVDGGSGVEFRQ